MIIMKYDTVKEAVDDLIQRGFTYDFNVDEKKLCSRLPDKGKFRPDEFKITEVHRFEGDSNPGDSSVVYAIQSEKYKVKGFAIAAFGMYADTHTTELLSKIEIEQ
jgi:hypothetical protein